MIGQWLLWGSVTIHRRTDGATDAYGNPTSSWDPTGETVAANVQPFRADETNTVDASSVEDMRRLWTAPGVDLDAGDRVTHESQTWEVEGVPFVWSTPDGPHHLEAKLKLVEDVS